jgi:hypothetical protein
MIEKIKIGGAKAPHYIMSKLKLNESITSYFFHK